MKYSVVLHTDNGVNYGATVPDLPGCFSAGDTFDEALEMVKEAISSHLELLHKNGENIPTAHSMSAHQDNPDYTNGIWEEVDVSL